MPGKKKKERKPPPGARKGKNKAAPGPKGRPQHGAQQDRMRPTGQKHQGGHASKAFTLVDEALGSTRLGSKRLWKGAAATSKLRHLPVIFIRAAEAYDPSKVLRDQIAATVLAEPKVTAEDVTMDATEVSVLDDVLPKDSHSELEQELLSTLHGDVPAETSTPVERLARQVQPTETTPADAFAAATPPAAIEERVKTPSFSNVPEAQAASDRPRLSSSAPVDLDALLESMGVVDTELEQQVQSQAPSEIMAEFTAGGEEDDQDSGESDWAEDSNFSGSSEEILEEEQVSFYVDTEGDTTFASLDIQSTSARPLTLTAASTPARVAASGDSTPWARTIDDPVTTEHAMPTTSEEASFGNVVEQSGGRGKRGGRRKRERQEMVQEQLRMDEAYAIHLDYMENSRWRDAGDSDDAEEIEDEEDDGNTPLLARMLAGLGPANTFGNTEPMNDSELDDEDDEDDEDAEEEDESMDDDALEAFLDAESQLVDFGRSGRKASRRAYNDYSADALFHDDFNVYDYNSAGEDDLESLPDLPASGARRRDLNQFVQDLDLSDEELELELIAQWKADKASKKSRKRERQQQHADGLLGKRAKRARAAHAQNGGETLGEYHSIIKRFVSHADYVGVAQLPLPAMDRSVRRAVHIIAQHGYQLQTKSQGSGKRRYPVLYKTQHTCTAERLPDALFMEEIMAQAQKTIGYTSSIKHRSALQPGGKVKGKGKGKGGAGGGIGKAAGGGAGKLRDGEVVGEHAPEIGLSNRGRAMLEKLGWSRGTGLGVAGNVGISVPIMATVKNSRVGLGT